jgi:hypothetical protein
MYNSLEIEVIEALRKVMNSKVSGLDYNFGCE